MKSQGRESPALFYPIECEVNAMALSLPYYYGHSGEQYAFFRIPKLLITDSRFDGVSSDAKLLYGLLLDRMELSYRNGWVNDQNRVFIIFTVEEVMETLRCRSEKAVRLFAEFKECCVTASPCRERRTIMAKNNKADMSCARVKKYTASDVSKAERHNERKNETYENMNVIEERIPFNVHFKTPTAPTYMEQLKQMETDGLVSLRGLRKDATLFNEIVIDVNTMYFERNGGYEYAKQFYEEAFHFIEEKFGAENVISAVMHADEINIAATEELGKEVYHYHLHAMVLPVVEKEILWSKRCKDEKLRGTVKEVVHQISHSKKWKSDIPLTDEKGNPLLRKNGKPMFRASYSILQDELFNHMTEQGFKGFQRGEYGSTAEHLTSLQYQIKQDKERLEKLQKRIQREQIKYEPARNVSKTYNEIDRMGQKTITGKMAISKEDYSELTALAKEGITSRAEISELEQSANYYRQKYFDCANALERMKTKYNELKEKCRPFLQALEHFPEVAKLFTEKVKQLFSFKEAQERAEKEAREKERQERIKARRNKRGMER